MQYQPTIFHITHWKSGSQWVREILLHSAPERFVAPQFRGRHFFGNPILPGMIYPAVFIPRKYFEAALNPFSRYFFWNIKNSVSLSSLIHNNENFQKNHYPYITFLVIRDLRDTLVSWYYSLKMSHVANADIIQKRRNILAKLDKDSGFRYLFDELLESAAKIQLSWISEDILVVKYKDLMADEFTTFKKILDYCQIEIKEDRLRDIVKDNTFKAVTGRNRGEEDVAQHLRKGIVGDWRNHFSESIKDEFKERFGHVLIKTGYEENLDW